MSILFKETSWSFFISPLLLSYYLVIWPHSNNHILWILNFWAAYSSNKLSSICSSIQSLSCVQIIVTSWTAAPQVSQSITNSQSFLKLISIKLEMPSNHLILCHPLLPSSIFPSIRGFSNESVLHIRWPMNIQYWFPLGWTGWISLQSKGFSRVSSSTTVWKHQFFGAKLSL